MPLHPVHREALKVIAANRSPDSYIAGGTVGNVAGPRYSADIDIFHGDPEVCLRCYDADKDSLEAAGWVVTPVIQPRPGFVRAQLTAPDGGRLKMDWSHETGFRFFPVISDEVLIWTLHWADAATNKALACAVRSEIRDAVDLMHWTDCGLGLAGLVLAATGKDPGFSPDFMLDEIIRNARINPQTIGTLDLAEPLDAMDLRRRFIAACQRARSVFGRIPADLTGAVFLDGEGRVIDPDPDIPATLSRPHFGTQGGCWPQVVEDRAPNSGYGRVNF